MILKKIKKYILEGISLTSRELLEAAVMILDGKKAENITAINIASISSLADYFLLCSGNSITQVKSLAEELEFKLSQQGINPRRIEGAQTASWIILDYGEVVIHVFYRETRQFYNLERLWADGKTIDLSNLLTVT